MVTSIRDYYSLARIILFKNANQDPLLSFVLKNDVYRRLKLARL